MKHALTEDHGSALVVWRCSCGMAFAEYRHAVRHATGRKEA